MSRKLDHHCKTIVGVLHDLLLNTNWELKEIKDANRSEVSRILSESKLFLSTSFEEGFGLPVAEAMISECIIVGYDGYGGRDLSQNESSFFVANGDLNAFVSKLKHIIDELNMDFNKYENVVQINRQFVLTHYSRQEYLVNLERIWKTILIKGSE